MRKILPSAFICLPLLLFSQFPKDFSWPIDSVIVITGNYGQIRPNHFHYGHDLSIGGKDGLKILAAADGYISRIRVGTGGYGKAVYITHPNGYTTVYGHLRAITGDAGAFVKKKQYENRQFEFEYYPSAGEFPVKKGQMIGEGGNTGFSSGPHLHFEIRRTSSEKVIHPGLFGLTAPDTVPPVIEYIAMEPLDGNSAVNNMPVAGIFKVVRKKGRLSPDTKDTIRTRGRTGISFSAYDHDNRKKYRQGLYRVELQVNGETVFEMRLDSFSFPESRAVNAHAGKRKTSGSFTTFEKCYRLRCDPLSVYAKLKDNGIVAAGENSVVTITLNAYDFSGNRRSISFPIHISPSLESGPGPLKAPCDLDASMETPRYRLNLPKGALYEDLGFLHVFEDKYHYSLFKDGQDEKKIPGALSSPFTLFPTQVSSHIPFQFSIRWEGKQATDTQKLVLARVEDKDRLVFAGGSFSKGWVSAELRDFGTYLVAADTVPPRILKHSSLNTPVPLNRTIYFRLSDGFSGIRSWSAEIDGVWHLSEYEPKTGLLALLPDGIKSGKHVIKLRAEDRCGNESVKTFEIILK